MHLYIKPLTSKDEEKALALLRREKRFSSLQEFPFPALGLFVGKEELIALLSYAQNALTTVFDHNIKAYYAFLDEAMIFDRPLYHLSLLFVDPSIRRKGLGTMLEKDFEKRYPGSDLLIEIEKGDHVASSFLTKRGFILVPSRFHLHEEKELYYKPCLKEGLCSRGSW